MLSESEIMEKIRSGGTVRVAAYPWGIEFEEANSANISRPKK